MLGEFDRQQTAQAITLLKKKDSGFKLGSVYDSELSLINKAADDDPN